MLRLCFSLFMLCAFMARVHARDLPGAVAEKTNINYIGHGMREFIVNKLQFRGFDDSVTAQLVFETLALRAENIDGSTGSVPWLEPQETEITSAPGIDYEIGKLRFQASDPYGCVSMKPMEGDAHKNMCKQTWEVRIDNLEPFARMRSGDQVTFKFHIAGSRARLHITFNIAIPNLNWPSVDEL